MKPMKILWTLGLAASCLWRPSAAPAAEPIKRPNFLVIVADDMGFSDAGCYGGEIATPNLDALAANGLRFSQFYSTARCWPSRACILTGYYAQQARMDPPRGRLPAWTRVLPHYFKELGYRSYHSGKWHLMGAPKRIADGGFDRSYSLEDHDRHFTPKKNLLDDQTLPEVKESEGYYSTTAAANYAIDFLKEHQAQHAEKPFLLYLAFISPHFPLQALPQDIERYKDRFIEGWDVSRERRWKRATAMGLVNCALSPLQPDYIAPWSLPEPELQKQISPGEAGRAVAWNDLTAEQKKFQAMKMAIHAAMVDRMDQEIGRVLAQIKAMRQFENTVIFFVSDNGASAEQIIRGDKHDPTAPLGSAKSYMCLGPGWSSAGNAPFRLHKYWVPEGGISSPLIVHWPAGLKAKGEIRHNPGHFVDLLPTMLDLAGAKPGGTWNGEKAPPLPGRSLAPAFAKDGTVPHDVIYFSHQGNRAIRVGDDKLVSAGTNGVWELYNLKTDRAEMNNLAASQPEKARRLSELWQQKDGEFKQQAGEPPPEQKAGKKGRQDR
jgi:arylsulfatase A-like enzyme